MKQILITVIQRALACVFLTPAMVTPSQAETITIGRGTGIVWEGLPFSQTLSGSMTDPRLVPRYGLLAVSNSSQVCLQKNILRTIGGYLALPLNGVPGVGLLPRSSGTTSFTLSNGLTGQMSGTIGLPETIGTSTEQVGAITSSPPFEWCLPPAMGNNNSFYSTIGPRTATLSGNWVMVADGSQQSGEGTVPPMYFGSFAAVVSGDRRVSILPTNITLRISTLACIVNTPVTINFGTVERNTQINAELASRSVPFVVYCDQPSDFIDANINVQLRALTSLYGGEPSRLALSQGGGFITGEIDGGVTGSGACTATSGVRFNGTPMKIGDITRAQTHVTLSNQLTWRLCSGGASLPHGAVDAATEMLVTFN